MTEYQDTSKETLPSDTLLLGRNLATAMLAHDRGILPFYYLLLILPELLLTSFRFLEQELAAVEFGSRAIQLFIVYRIGRTWIGRVQVPGHNGKSAFAQLFLYGMGFWAILALPISLLFLIPQELGFFVIVALIPVIVFALRYYFFFIPVIAGAKTFQEIIQLSADMTKGQLGLALRALIPPFGLMLIASSLLIAPSPDGRSLVALYLVDLSSGIFPLLSTYLAFGLCFATMPGQVWNALSLNPYRESTLETIALEQRSWLTSLLEFRRGMIFVLVGLLISLGNDMRAQSLLPTPAISIISSTAKEGSVKLVLSLDDTTYHFRSFRPSFFRLSGPSGKDLGFQMPDVLYQGKELPPFFRLPQDPIYAELEIRFQTDRKDHELTELKDIYLWYRNAKIQKLTITEEPNEAGTSG